MFDLGETLLSFGRIKPSRFFRQGAGASYDYLKSCGLSVGSFIFYYWRGMLSLYFHRALSKITGRDFNSLVVLKGIGSRKGLKLSESQWQHFDWLWYEPLSKVGKPEPKIKETLTALENSGLKLGILSNTFISASSLDRHLEQAGILEFFPVRLYSYEFDFRKPDVRIFQAAAEQIGEKPENILFAGDRIDKDVKPAVKAGMHAVLIEAYTNIGKRIPEGVWKINLLSELPDLIKKINADSMQKG